MADAQLSTSITSISERASEVAQAASADELQKISRVAPSLEQSENAALEVAINTRAAAIAGTASAADLKKIGKAIGNMLEPQTTSVSGEFIGSQTNHAGKFFSTNGTSKNWGGVTMGGLQQIQLSTIENDQTLVYNSVSGKFENSSRAFDIPQYSLTQNLPASANAGEVVFDVQSSQLKYWDGSEWKVAAVVAAASGGVSIVSVTVTEKFGQTETNSMVSGNSESYAGLGNYDNIRFSPNGQNMIIGAGHYKTPGVGRGSTWIVDTSDLDNITYEQWRPQYYRNGFVDTDYAAMGAYVDITDTHVATYAERVQAPQLLDEAVFNAAVSNHANTPWPLGYLASGSVNWMNFNPIISIAPLDNLSSPFFLAATGNFIRNDYHGGVFGMSGNYVALGTNARPYGPYNEGSEGAYAAGMWVYDITDSESTFTGNDFTANNTYLDTRNQNIIFPKYFIPRYSAGSLSDYDNRYVFVDVSGDYIIRGAGNANGGQGRVEIYKISQLQTIVSGNAQVAPHAVINGDGVNTPNNFGYKVSTDGNKIIVGGTGGSGNKVIVYDMDGTVVHTINAGDFISGQLTSLDISPYYIGFGAKNSNTGASSGGEYAILALNDPTSVLKTESGSSNNERMGDSFAFGHDTNVYAFTSMMSNESGRLSINEIIATTDSAGGSGESSGVVTDYHTTYLTETGGTLFEVTYSGSGVDSLNATIDSMSSGDALLLSAGQYVIDSTVGNDSSYGQSLTRNKDIAIVGNTLEPKDVVVTGNPVQSGEAYTIFEWNSTLQRQFANMRLVRIPVGLHDYQASISGNNPGAGSGKMKNVILDFNGGNAAWAYRGVGLDTNSIILENISFVNYSTWLGNHHSENYHITVINSGFEGTYNKDHPLHTNSSNLVENVTYDSNYDYTDTTLYGHKKDMVASQGSSGESTPVDWSPLTISTNVASSVYTLTGGTTGESDLAVDMTDQYLVVGIDKAYSGYGAIKLIDPVTANTVWSVNNPNPVTAGSFGRRNSVGTDGTHVVAGNRDQDEVYVYDMSGTLLRTISGPDSGAQFGHSVKIDGDYIAVGGYNQDKAYICSTSTGAVLHTLTNPNVYGSTPDQFGQVVDISGNFMVVSTVEEDAADGSNSGVAYVYTVDAGSLLHTFVNPNAHGTSALDNFGIDCALDGNYLVVGAFGESDAAVGAGSGKAYFYNVATGTLLHTIDNPNPDSGTDVDYMGWSVAVDGQTALVSAWYETGTAGADAGKCYLYDIVSGSLLHTIEDPDLYSASGTDDRFGSEVAISGNYFAVSAKGEDHASQDNVGAIYVFKGE